MADTERRFSELSVAATLTDNDILALSQTDIGTSTLISVRATLIAIATHIAKVAAFTNDLDTTNKTLIGAINELKQLISLIPQFSIEVVQTLPVSDISETTIYLVPNSTPEQGNYYEEYIYVNNTWELVGTTAVDLSAYYTKLEVDVLLANKVDKVSGKGLSTNDFVNTADYVGLGAGKAVLGTFAKTGTDTDPYVFRQFPASASGAVRENLKKIIGASVVWNQLCKNGNFADGTNNWSKNANSTWSVSENILTLNCSTNTSANRIYQNISAVSGHKYLLLADMWANRSISGFIGLTADGTNGDNNISITDTRTRIGIIINNSANEYLVIGSNTTYSTAPIIYVANVQVIDLTALFGSSTVADYVNTLETAEAGSGIAWLQKYGFFTEEYYAYSTNTIQSVSVSGHKIVGKNMLNAITRAESTTNGIKSKVESGNHVIASGTSSGNGDINITPLNNIFVKNGEKITISLSGTDTRSGSLTFYLHDSSGYFTYLSAANTSHSVTFTISKNRTIDGFLLRTSNNSTITLDAYIQVELGNIATSFSPYTAEITALDHTTLRGLFKLDANNNLYADGDIYNADGSGSVKYAEVDMGTLDWTYDAQNNRFQTVDLTSTAKGNATTVLPNILCAKYTTFIASDTATTSLGITLFTSNNYVYVRVIDPNYTSKESFTTAMNGVKLIYEKATPTTTALTPFNPLSVIEQGGTEEFADYGVEQGNRDVAIPCGQETDYYSVGTPVSAQIPDLPILDGDYTLKLTVSSGQPTFKFE